MPYETNNNNRLQDILIGAAIGAVLVWILFGRQGSQGSQQTAISAQIYPQQLYMMQNRIQQLEHELGQYQHIQSLPPSNYKNAEKWAISRNKDGFISNIEILRDAKVS